MLWKSDESESTELYKYLSIVWKSILVTSIDRVSQLDADVYLSAPFCKLKQNRSKALEMLLYKLIVDFLRQKLLLNCMV